MSTASILLLVAILLAALGFDITNGMNDLSGLLATTVRTRAASRRGAQIVVIIGVVVGLSVAPPFVARTLGEGLVHWGRERDGSLIRLSAILASLLGALIWNLWARSHGMPASSTHGLVGGLIAAGLMAHLKPGSLHWGLAPLLYHLKLAGAVKVVAGLIFSPVLGFILGYFIFSLLAWLLVRATIFLNRVLRYGELAALFLQSVSYGCNDAQKSIAMITTALYAANLLAYFQPPWWASALAGVALSIGCLLGSLRIFRTVGFGIVRVRPLEAFSAQISAAGSVALAALTGAPVSSTQVVSGSVIGVGARSRFRGVRWLRARDILMTWFVTIPGAGLVTALIYLVFRILLKV